MNGPPGDLALPQPRSAQRERFAELVTTPGGADAIPLAEAALWLAAEECEHLDVEHYLGRLDELGREARQAVEPRIDETERIIALNEFLFEAQRFIGNQTDYYDPRNSFLNEVLERRTGIPITLSILYLEIASHVEIEAAGVGFPGHFLVRAGSNGLIIDPFGGQVLTQDDCRDLLRQVAGDQAELDEGDLAEISAAQILTRMLINLKQIYLQSEKYERALACIERTLLIVPDSPLELRDRGLVYANLECFGAALTDLEAFVERAGPGPGMDSIRELLDDLRIRARQVH